MKKEICCKRCDAVIANDDGVCLVPVKSRMRFNYKEMKTTILCHCCNFLSYFKGSEYLDDSEQRNSRFILNKKITFKK